MADWWDDIPDAPLATGTAATSVATLDKIHGESWADSIPDTTPEAVAQNYQEQSQTALLGRAKTHVLGRHFQVSDVHGPIPELNTDDVEKQATEHIKQFPGVNPIEAASVYQRAKHYYRLAASQAGDIEPSGRRQKLADQTIDQSKITERPRISEGENLEHLQKVASQVPVEDRPMFLSVMSDYMNDRKKKTPERTFSEKFMEKVNRGTSSIPNSLASLPKYFGNDPKAAEDWRFLQQIRGIKQGLDPATSDNWIAKGILGAAEMAPPMVAGGVLGGGVGVLAGEAAAGAAGTGFWYTQTVAPLYEELREQGIDAEKSKMLSAVFSAPIAAVENLQVGQAAKPLAEGAKAAAGESMSKYLLTNGKKLAKEFIKTNAVENVEELGQNLMQLGVKAFGTYLDENAKDIDWKKEGENQVEQAVASALAMPFLLAPGAALQLGRGVIGKRFAASQSNTPFQHSYDKVSQLDHTGKYSEVSNQDNRETGNAKQESFSASLNANGGGGENGQSTATGREGIPLGGQGGGEIPGAQQAEPVKIPSKSEETQVNPYNPIDSRYKTWAAEHNQAGTAVPPTPPSVNTPKTVGSLPTELASHKPEDYRERLWKDAQAIIASDPDLPEPKGRARGGVVKQAVDKAARAGLINTREEFDGLLDQLTPYESAPHKEQAKAASDALNALRERQKTPKTKPESPADKSAEKPEPHKYSSTQIALPPEIAFKAIAVTKKIATEDLAEDGRETEPHVTVKYGLHTGEAEHVREIVKDQPPIRVTLGKTSIFPADETTTQRGSPQYDVVKVDVNSDDLRRINKLISDSLEHTDTHPTYNPHLTLAYVKPGTGQKYVGMTDLEGSQAEIKSITFSGKDREHVEIPLTGNPAVPTAGRLIVKDLRSGKETVIPERKTAGVKPVETPAAEQAPQEQPTKDYGTAETPNREALGEHFADKLSGGERYASIVEARQQAGKLIGGDIQLGTQAAKSVDEAVEQGVVRATRKIIDHGVTSGDEHPVTFDSLVDLYNRQPSFNVRTSTSMREQAYSTPAPLAFIASRLAEIGPKDVTYDSSAGNGMLLTGTPIDNARANELNRERAASLRAQGIETTNRDATKYRHPEVDAVIINPPFGRVIDEAGNETSWTIDGVTTNQVDHAITLNTLASLKPNGRAVVILGAKGTKGIRAEGGDSLDRAKAYSNPSGKPFYDHIYDTYNVTDHFTVSGDLYSKQGAGFPVDVLVIDGLTSEKVQSRPRPWNIKANGVPEIFDSWEGLKDAKLVNRPEREQQPGQPESRQPASSLEPRPGGVSGAGTEGGQGNDLGAIPEQAEVTPQLDEGTRQGTGEGTGEALPASVGGSHGPNATAEGELSRKPPRKRRVSRNAGGQRGTPGPVSNESTAQPGSPGSVAPISEPGGLPSERVAGKELEQKQLDIVPKKQVKASQATENSYQVPYKPKSELENVDTLLPRNHVDAVERALEAISERYGDLDTFVADQLGLPKNTLGKRFSAEQVDAIALAISNHKAGQGFILGDQTGVGKGRVAAGLMRYADRQGLVPIFVTEKPNLYSDMIRDITDIGLNTEEDPFNILMTNAVSGDDTVVLPDGRELTQSAKTAERNVSEAINSFLNGDGLTADTKDGPVKYGAIFTTYSQLQSVGGKQTWRQSILGRASEKAFFLLDESHNAGGTKIEEGNDRGPKEKAPGRADIVRELIATSPGVYYSSATFAKRPEVMDLYARAGLGKAVANPKDLAAAINTGGVPLQQVVSEMLAEAGQYLRRERSYDGVEFASKTANIDLGGADKVSDIFRDIQEFDKFKEGPVKEAARELVSAGGATREDMATGKAGVDSTNFTSILHNIVDQQLIALKADVVADQAISAWKAGETPVIALDNTMEAALGHYLEKHPASIGQPITFSFGNLLQRYLDRTREILVVPDRGDPKKSERHYLTDEELGPQGVEMFNTISEKIKAFDVKLPASPIDWIRYRLEQAGMKVAEITGRKRMVEYSGDMNNGMLRDRPESESGVAGKVKTIAGVNAGSIDAVILNRSGATGVSMHASGKFQNQRPRHMFIAQAAKNIDEFMQMLGRIHRTGQVKLPKYTLMMSDAPAENRPASVLTKKLSSLNANVTGASKGAVGFEASDIMNKIGDEIVLEYMRDNRDLNSKLGDPLPISDSGSLMPIEDAARKVTGRVALLPVTEQATFWDDITSLYDNKIAELDSLGNNPLTAKTLPLEAKTIERFPISEGNEESKNPFEHPAYLEKISAKRVGKPFSSKEVEQKVHEVLGSANLQEVVAKQALWTEKQIDEIQERGREFANKRIAEAKTEQAKTSLKEQFSEQFETLRDMFTRFPVGRPVYYQAWFGVMEGVVTSIRKTGKGKNPLAPSTWVADILVSDATRRVSVPLTKLKETAENAVVAAKQRDLPEFIAKFDENTSESRDERYVATGNLLSAYSALADQRGQISFFTDDAGQVRRGILMPAKFDATTWQEERPVPFENVDLAKRFMAKGGTLYAPDKSVWVSEAGSSIVIRTYKARSRGGKYTTDGGLLRAAEPKEFVSKGAIMEMVVPPEQANAVLGRLIEITSLQANDNRELARDVVTKLSEKKTAGENTKPAITESGNVMRISAGGPGGGILGSPLKLLKKYLTSRGNLPESVFDRKVERDGSIGAEMVALKFQTAKFEDALRDYSGSVKLSEAGRKLVDDALHGDITALGQLPDKVRESVLEMRQHIDTLSRRLIDNGLAEGDLEVTIEQNMGVYVTRSYKVFDDPNWKNKVAPEVRNKAFVLLQGEFPNKTDEEIRNMIDDMLYKENAPLAMVSGKGRLGAKDLSIVKARKDIAPEIRALLGEYDDPMVNYVRSVTKMANLVANHEFLTDVKEFGTGRIFFEQDDPDRPAGYNAKFASDDSKVLGPLNGMMTTPEIKEAFEQAITSASHGMGWVGRQYMKGVLATKHSKTVLSTVGHVRNFLSNTFFAIQNGHLNVFKFVDATKTSNEMIRAELPAVLRSAIGSDTAWQERAKKYVRLKLVDQSIHAGELRDAIRDASNEVPGEVINNPLYQVLKSVGKIAGALYQAGDNVWKILAFENERARYVKAYEKAGIVVNDEELDRLIAKIIRNLYPTADMVPEVVKQLRRAPIIAPFASFPAEVIRTQFHSLKLAAAEMQDPALRTIGITRLLGNLAALAIPDLICNLTRFLVGATDDDDDDLRRFIPGWSTNSNIAWLYKSAGKIGYIDLGAFFPNSSLRKPVMALLRGDDWQASFWEAAKELMGPYLGEELFFEKLIDIKRNQTNTERPHEVYNPESPWPDQVKSSLAHIWTAFEPGIVSSAMRIKKAAEGTVEKSGRSYNLAYEALAPVTGLRVQEADIEQSLSYNASKYEESLRDAGSIFTSLYASRGTQNPDEIYDSYQKANDARERVFNDLHEQTLAAMAFGVPRANVIGTLATSGISKIAAEKIIRGQYEPYFVSTEIQAKISTLPGAAERTAAFMRAAKNADQNNSFSDKFAKIIVTHANALTDPEPKQSAGKKRSTWLDEVDKHKKDVAKAREALKTMGVSTAQVRRELTEAAKRRGDKLDGDAFRARLDRLRSNMKK